MEFMLDLFRGEHLNVKLKLMLVGLKMAGKTSFAKTLINNEKTLTKEDERTVGIDILKWSPPEIDPINLDIWDFAGHKEYYITHQFFITRRCLYFLVFDISRLSQDSHSKGKDIDECCCFDCVVQYWIDSIQAHAPGSSIVLIATHADLIPNKTILNAKIEFCFNRLEEIEKQRRQSLEDGFSFMASKFIESSPYIEKKLGLKVGKLASNIPLEEKLIFARDILHGRKLIHVFPEMERWLRNYITTLDSRPKLPKNKEEIIVCGLGNIDSNSLKSLTTSVHNVIRINSVSEKIGPNYFAISKLVRQIKADQVYIGKQKFLDLLKSKMPNLSEEFIWRVVQFLHDIGDLLYYPENDRLSDFVFLQPQWLVDVIKYLIRHDLNKNLKWKYEMKHLCPKAFKFEEIKDNFLNHGIAEPWFLEQIWLEQKLEQSLIGYLIEFLRKFEILIETVDQSGKKLFLLPSLMQNRSLNELSDWKSSNDQQVLTQVGRKFVFPFYAPPGLFSRFLAKAFSLGERQSISQNILILLFKNGMKVLCHCYRDENSQLIIDLVIRCDFNKHSHEQLAIKLELFVSTLEQLLDEWPGLTYDQYCICFCRANDTSHVVDDLKIVTNEAMQSNETIFCQKKSVISISTLLSSNQIPRLEKMKKQINKENKEKEIIQNQAGAKKIWQQDSEVSQCNLCKKQFTIFRRRHHCRECLLIYCDDCSNHQGYSSEYGKLLVRLCNNCFEANKQASEVVVKEEKTNNETKILSNNKNATNLKITKNCAICGKESTNRCGTCKIVYYCTAEHQRQHWAAHKLTCKKS